jgi:small subunit ribosomal protein S21
MSIEIKIRKNEPVDRAIRRMKKKLDRENIIKGVRAKRYFEKPCEKRRRKEKVQEPRLSFVPVLTPSVL